MGGILTEQATSPGRPARPWMDAWVVKKERRTLTIRGRLLVAAVLALAVMTGVRQVHPFLAVTDLVGADVLVVEGWIPDRAYAQVAELYRQGGYEQLVIVISVYDGDVLHDSMGGYYDDYLKGLAVRQGVPALAVTPVLCQVTYRDRTFHCARVARRWLEDQRGPVAAIDVATMGPHARRSRLLYRRAFGTDVGVGVAALADWSYEPARWWGYSEGIRDVIVEGVGYLYAAVLFRPPSPPDDDAPYVIPGRAGAEPNTKR